VLDAVLFDWGDTLMRFEWDEERVAAGHAAGLEAAGVEPLADAEAVSRRFIEHITAHYGSGVPEELEYPGLVRSILGEFGVALDDEQLAAFLEAEHAAWDSARRLAATSHALLDALRADGLRLGLVSNTFDPPWLLYRDLEQLGLAQRVDAVVLSSELGYRKPHPQIFEAALARLGVAPERALFVGDRLYEDVLGASRAGMTTVQALWFRADEHQDGGEPDFQAFTQMDVLNIARRLAARVSPS
jgi:putative hydrolase of the HAD superfamily